MSRVALFFITYFRYTFNMTLNVNVETKNLVKIFTIAVLFTLGVLALMRMYDTLVLVLTAFFFAIALNPAVSFISKGMPGKRRGPAVFIVIIAALALLSVLVFSIITPVAREASAFAETVPQRIQELQSTDSAFGRFVEKYSLQDDIADIVNSAQDRLEQFATNAVQKVGQFGSSLLTSITGMVMTILMLTGGPRLLKNSADKLYRDKSLRARHEDVLGKMYGVVTGYVNGQVLIALVASLVALGVMFLLQIPYPLPLAAIVFIFGLIPLIGNTIAAILVVLFTLILKDITAALMLVAFFVLYQQIENATLQPVVQGRTTQLPTVVIFVAVILGVAVMGPIGGLFAIPAAGCSKVLLNDYLEHRPHHPQDTPKNLVAKVKSSLKKAAG